MIGACTGERPNSDRSLFSHTELPCAALVQIDCAIDTGCARAAICNGHAHRSVGAVRAAHGVKRQRRAPVHGHLDVAVPLLDSPASQIMHTLMLGSSELIRISGRAAGLLVHKLLAALQTPVRCPGVMRNGRTPHARTPCPTGLGFSRVHSYFQRSCTRPGLGPRRRLPAT